jgi:hypothetical protein
MAITEIFTPLKTLPFFNTALPYDSPSIREVSEGDLCSKAHNFMYARRSIADIFKCDEPTICRNKKPKATMSKMTELALK